MRNFTEQQFNIDYDKYKDVVYRVAYSYVKSRDDASDLTQEVFMKYIKCTEDFKEDANKLYWLIRVTINMSKSFLRSYWKRNVELDDSIQDTASRANEEEIDYFNAITSLNSKYKDVLIMFYWEGLSINEIARVLKISSSNVKTRLSRARELLKRRINNG